MNERFKQLADSAAKYSAVMSMKSDKAADELFVEHFAELIVRECAEICLEANDHKNILRHFGVKG